MLDNEPNEEEWSATLTLDIRGVRNLRDLLNYVRTIWPGSPARPAEEQEFIIYMQELMNRLSLEYTFEHAELPNGRDENG